MTSWETMLAEERDRHRDLVFDFLRIPSVSALPEHAADVQRAAQWVADRLSAAGVEAVQVMPTGGHPIVVGSWLHAANKPTVLIYGHFDVQPADPMELWTTPPFDPHLRDGRIYARGASDDKGNMLAPVLAVEALLKATGTLPVNLKIFFEGQEEILSPQVPDFIMAHRELLACDLVISADSGQFAPDQPSLLVGTRGICGLQVDVRGPATDLHSGIFGGAVANPIHALAEVLASLHAADGRITVEGFYDEVAPLSDQDRAELGRVPFDSEALKGHLGIDAFVGEAGYSVNERRWTRPTLEVNGIWGGFQGHGVKTVLPSSAHAKITCRLVPNQDPAKLVERVANHITAHAPAGVTVSVNPFDARSYPYTIPSDHWGNQAAKRVLQELYGVEPVAERTGGSVPVCELFLRELGAYTVGFGFGHDDENAHAPDEFIRVESFERAPVAHGRLLSVLGEAESRPCT